MIDLIIVSIGMLGVVLYELFLTLTSRKRKTNADEAIQKEILRIARMNKKGSRCLKTIHGEKR